MRHRSYPFVLVPALVLITAACDTDDGRELREPTSEQRAAMTTVTSTTTVPSLPPDVVGQGAVTTFAPATSTTAGAVFSLQAPWPDGGPIDVRFTCDGDDRSPTLTWTAPPAGTVELVLLVTDDDAGNFVHWAVAAIPPAAGEVGEGGQITGATEGRNDFGNPGWGGPCPPSGRHTYRFAMYALSQQAELPDEFGGGDLEALANTAAIGVAETTGTYARG